MPWTEHQPSVTSFYYMWLSNLAYLHNVHRCCNFGSQDVATVILKHGGFCKLGSSYCSHYCPLVLSKYLDVKANSVVYTYSSIHVSKTFNSWIIRGRPNNKPNGHAVDNWWLLRSNEVNLYIWWPIHKSTCWSGNISADWVGLLLAHVPEEGWPNQPKHHTTNVCFWILLFIYLFMTTKTELWTFTWSLKTVWSP